MTQHKYNRILLKISGEGLLGGKEFGIEPERMTEIAQELVEVKQLGVQLGVVVGGGNIFRGLSGISLGIDRIAGDFIGMLATIMNSLALQTVLEKRFDVDTRVLSEVEVPQLAEPYIRRRAIRHLEKGRIVIFAGGTGKPFFTTDTAAALKAAEVSADVLLKATRVDGVFSDDPEKNPNATFYKKLPYRDVLSSNLRVMDSTAVSMCMENSIPIVVFNFSKPGNLIEVVRGKTIGTTIS
ncbi:MAG: UMP kinase [candidate division Zixibacteria bacterium 4484_93]|nr:MAG: UMP kinase [candidate division Zixibacteria bacterium 4484_93]